MIINAITMLNLLKAFRKEEGGLALTEYLILLGLLTGAVVLAVLAFGTQLGTEWQTWADWLTNSARIGAPAEAD